MTDVTDDPPMSLEQKVLTECRRYGLETMADGDPEVLFDVLLRHIYRNRDLVYALKDLTMDDMEEKIRDLKIEVLDLKEEVRELRSYNNEREWGTTSDFG